MTIGERIQKARKAAKLSQKELGEKLGVSASMIGQYENNLRKPKTETLFRIAEALNVDPKDLGHDHTFFFSDYAFLDSEEYLVKVKQGSYLTGTELPLISAFRKLNDDGKKKAVERVEELTEIQKYQALNEEISKLPDDALPVIVEYIQDVAKDPEGYLKHSEAERRARILEFTEKIAKAIQDAK